MAFIFDVDRPDLREILEIKFLSLKYAILKECPALSNASNHKNDNIFLSYLDSVVVPYDK